MEINIDLLVAGCNTCCLHCYVNGGPSPMMPMDDALLCIEKNGCGCGVSAGWNLVHVGS